jgi:hypothetical protein
MPALSDADEPGYCAKTEGRGQHDAPAALHEHGQAKHSGKDRSDFAGDE